MTSYSFIYVPDPLQVGDDSSLYPLRGRYVPVPVEVGNRPAGDVKIPEGALDALKRHFSNGHVTKDGGTPIVP